MTKIIPGYDCVADVRRIRKKIWDECGHDVDEYHRMLEKSRARFLAAFGSDNQVG